MVRVLISAVGTMASVSYIRLLKEKGFYVIGINSTSECVGPYICDEFYKVPLVSDVANYVKTIERINFDVFVPWLDEEHILFATNCFSFSNKVLTSPSSSILIATDKLLTYDFCEVNNIRTARKTTVVPAFVRAKFSRGSKFAKLVTQQDELNRLSKKDYLCQEVINGVEYTVDILCSSEGNFLYGVPRRRVQAINVSTISEIEMDAEIIDFCKRICDKLHFFGAINIQIFRSNDKLYLVEINPRLAGTSVLSIMAGFDLLTDSINQFLGNKINKEYHVKNGLRMYRYYNEIYV